MAVEITVRDLVANPAQRRCWDALMAPPLRGGTVVVRWLSGPASGKTTLSVQYACWLLARFPAISIGIFRETHASLDSTTRLDFQQAIPPEWYTSKSGGDIWQFDQKEKDHGRILWLGLENYRERRGLQIGAAIIDQAETVSEDQFDYVIERTRQNKPQKYPLTVLLLANVPEVEKHWLYTRFSGDHPDYRAIVGGLRENEANLPPAYVETMTTGRTPEYIARYIDGKYTAPTDKPAVYPTYREEMRLPQNIPAIPGTVHEGFDGGPTDNYLAYTAWQRQNDRVIILREFLGDHAMGVWQFGDRITAIRSDHFSGCQFVSDADPPMFVKARTDEMSPADILRQRGIILRKGIGEAHLRRSAVNDLMSRVTRLGEPVLAVNPCCDFVHRGFRGGYHREMDEEGSYTRVSKENPFSHIIESFEASYARSVRQDQAKVRYEEMRRQMRGKKPKWIAGAMR